MPFLEERVEELDSQVEERVRRLLSSAEDVILQLKNDAKRLMITIPKKVREMPLEEFQKQYPGDFQSGPLAEIRERYAAMAAAAAARPAPATAGRATVARTVARPKRGNAALRPPLPAPGGLLQPAEQPTAPPASTRSKRARTAAPAAAEAAAEEEDALVEAAPAELPTRRHAATRGAAAGTFNGMPLQTPMPFAGAAVPLPVTLLAQRQRPGRTAAAAAALPPVPGAAIITTADGKQWAVGKGSDGVAAIPESHRAEVAALLTAQMEFFAAALGKVTFKRGGR